MRSRNETLGGWFDCEVQFDLNFVKVIGARKTSTHSRFLLEDHFLIIKCHTGVSVCVFTCVLCAFIYTEILITGSKPLNLHPFFSLFFLATGPRPFCPVMWEVL